MNKLAIIGGTGLTSLKGLTITHKEMIRTPFGEPSGPLTFGTYCDHDVVFFARHGYGHTIPPHMVNYRANIWAMRHVGVKNVIAVAAVGGISSELEPGMLVIPHQIIDYTWSRPHTFFERDLSRVVHVDFTKPYCDDLRDHICSASKEKSMDVIYSGVYAAMQGPRLETAAEIDKLERDGCTVVGMTGMPEAGLARELDLCYASINVVANKAAGRAEGEITIQDIQANVETGMVKVRALIEYTIEHITSATQGEKDK